MTLLVSATTEGVRPFEVILSEGETIAREQVTMVAGQNLTVGAVLGKVTASGKYTLLAPAAADGSQVAAAVLLVSCDASAADKTALVAARLTELKGDLLTWPAGITAGQKTTALGQLATAFLIVR